MRNRLAILALLCFCAPVCSRAQTVTLGLNAAQLFDKGMNALLGSSASRNDVIALDSFHRSAELGYAPAQVVLGYLYETGRIVTPDPMQAFDWYKSAAGQDDPLAEWLVGHMIYSGAIPPRDLNEASLWFQKAASHNDPFGQYLLGRVKLERKDYAGAAIWLQKAALQGLPQAQQQLGLLLQQGRGVPEDKFEAYVWLLLSSESSHHSPGNDLQALEADLGSSQVEQAKSKAREIEASSTRMVLARGCTGWNGELLAIPAPPPPDIQRFCR
ncbi:MAG: tetratricopeptide repeat protein [Terriglobales bacterium]